MKRFDDLTKKSTHLECVIEKGLNFRDRIITLNEEITSDTFHLIDVGMTEMEFDSRKGITIKINSEGGFRLRCSSHCRTH